MREDRFEVERIACEHLAVTRRYFLALGGAGLAGLAQQGAFAQRLSDSEILARATAKLEFLTKDADFGNVERGNPLPYTLPEPKLREIGMVRETWTLEVIPDT